MPTTSMRLAGGIHRPTPSTGWQLTHQTARTLSGISAWNRCHSRTYRTESPDHGYQSPFISCPYRSHTGRDYTSAVPDIAQRDSSVALQLAVPIFDGFAKHYQVRAAEADADMPSAPPGAARASPTRPPARR